jgi:hypothetical protein
MYGGQYEDTPNYGEYTYESDDNTDTDTEDDVIEDDVIEDDVFDNEDEDNDTIVMSPPIMASPLYPPPVSNAAIKLSSMLNYFVIANIVFAMFMM